MAETVDPPEVVIVGAGPAGAAAAVQLARAGRRVALIDRKHFPRDKACGGCLSGATVRRLRRLVGEECPLPGIAGTRVTFVAGSYRLNAHADGRTRVVHRAELDAWLVERALQAGAQGLFGAPASLQDAGSSGYVVSVGDHTFCPPCVVLASGAGGLALKIGGKNLAAGPPMLAQQWVQPAGPGLPEPGDVELHWLRGGYVGLASPCTGDCVVALAARQSEISGESAYDRLRRMNPSCDLWGRLPSDAPRRFGARGAAGFPWMPGRVGRGNVLLAGDAAGYAEPYTGEGIGQAMLTAECAARAILDGKPILERYEVLLRRHHRPVVRRTRVLSWILQSQAVHRLASCRPVLPRGLLARVVRHVHVKGAP